MERSVEVLNDSKHSQMRMSTGEREGEKEQREKLDKTKSPCRDKGWPMIVVVVVRRGEKKKKC